MVGKICRLNLQYLNFKFTGILGSIENCFRRQIDDNNLHYPLCKHCYSRILLLRLFLKRRDDTNYTMLLLINFYFNGLIYFLDDLVCKFTAFP